MLNSFIIFLVRLCHFAVKDVSHELRIVLFICLLELLSRLILLTYNSFHERICHFPPIFIDCLKLLQWPIQSVASSEEPPSFPFFQLENILRDQQQLRRTLSFLFRAASAHLFFLLFLEHNIFFVIGRWCLGRRARAKFIAITTT